MISRMLNEEVIFKKLKVATLQEGRKNGYLRVHEFKLPQYTYFLAYPTICQLILCVEVY